MNTMLDVFGINYFSELELKIEFLAQFLKNLKLFN